MKRFFAFSALFIFFSSCKSKVPFVQNTYTSQNERILPYKLSAPFKKQATGLAVLLNDNPDSLKLATSALSHMLYKKHYSILIPGKPGEDIIEKQALDNKEKRIGDLTELISQQDTSVLKHLLIVGFGEGGYLAPALANASNAKKVVVVNAGPLSPLAEVELLLKQDSASPSLYKITKREGLYNTTELEERYHLLIENEFGVAQLPGGSNNYWMSYYRSPLINDLARLHIPALWYISEGYIMVGSDSRQMAKDLANIYQNMDYGEIPGVGAFNDPDEMKPLVELIKNFIDQH